MRPAPFAQRAQDVVITLLVASLVLLAQPFSTLLYRAGFLLLFVSVLVQMAVSNVTPAAGLRRTVTKSLVIFAIIAVIFALSIWVAPFLVGLGQTRRF